MPGTARVGNYSLECALPARRHELAFRAAHVLLPRLVRLVILHPTHGTRDAVARMLREACLVEKLRHPGIPRLYECGRLSTGRPWLAYELVEGPTLAESTTPRSPIEVLAILCELAEILAYAHAHGVVHGAVRPASIVRGAEQLYLCDWSHSQLVEQDPQADIYALGVLAVDLLQHAGPYDVKSLVDRMLAPDPADRPTAAEVVAEASRSREALEAIELALDGQTDPAIEDVVLVDIAEPGSTAVRWTPPLGTHPPDTIPIQNEPSRRR
ncbi:MAG TPA: hypothetical protein VIU61_10490 [Kofleriaceae bacterium]